MTTSDLTCRELDALLADLLEGALDGEQAARADAHLAACARCGALVGDLRAIRQAAAALPELEPPAAVWHRISAALESPSRRAAAVEPQPTAARVRRPAAWWATAAAAAALLVAVGSGLWSLWIERHGAPPGEPAAAAPADADPLAAVEAELALAAEHYQRALVSLAQTARGSESGLDPAIVMTLEANLALVDQAIADSRRALGAEPGSPTAQASLEHALRGKMALLQDTLGLIHELRLRAETEPAPFDEG